MTHYPKLINCWQDKLNDDKFMQQALLINKKVYINNFNNDELFWSEVIDQCKDLDTLKFYTFKFSGPLSSDKHFREKYKTAIANLKLNLQGK